MIELLPIWQTPEENSHFGGNTAFNGVIAATIGFYQRVGFHYPWIGYLVRSEGVIIGSAGFKGRPKDNQVEIAYGIDPEFRNRGLGTAVCRFLVNTALSTDPRLEIMARTLPDNNPSMAVLRKSGFEFLRLVDDADDGTVKEWRFLKSE